jgi:hypothetical protein
VLSSGISDYIWVGTPDQSSPPTLFVEELELFLEFGFSSDELLQTESETQFEFMPTHIPTKSSV